MWWLTRTMIFVLSFCAIFKINAQQDSISPLLKTKIHKALSVIYQKEGLQLKIIELNDGKVSEGKALNGHIYQIIDQNELKGYAFVAQAQSMKNVFDYLVVFNPMLTIEKAKVLIYREQHGRQIGTTRWLSQFKGMDFTDRPELGKQIDGISGATISAKSMTNAVHQLLVTLENYKTKGLL